MEKMTFESRLAEYQKNFKLVYLNTSNDQATLYALIRSELFLEKLQDQMTHLASTNNIMKEAQDLKRLSDLTRDTITNITAMQRTLAIDRKTRQEDSQESVAEYINSLKRLAPEWLEKLFIKVYCPNCKVMVSRILPVHEFTAFTLSTECSQCGKAVRAQRQGKDIFFDIRNAEWRKKYPVEIIQPVNANSGFDIQDLIEAKTADDLLIDNPDSTVVQHDEEIEKPSILLEEDRVIGGTHGTD